MNATKARVTVDFPPEERDVLQTLCEADYRLPSEQIRWLVIEAAKQRGLLRQENDAMWQLTQNDAGRVRQDTLASAVHP